MESYILFIFLISLYYCSGTYNYSEINLDPDHLRYFFNMYKELGEACMKDDCPLKEYVGRPGCWGYEGVCPQNDTYSVPSCPGDHKGWVPSKKDQIQTFYTQGDFGYIAEQQKELMVICEPNFLSDSSLMCSKHLRYCQGRNIMVDFRDLINRKEPIRYKMDVLKEGEIGGFCKLHRERLTEECDHISPLQSWGPELRYFTELPHRPIDTEECDVVIDKPTYFMKIDATVNMYHHFCDFFNLYASQHVKLHDWTTFSTDVHVLIWESFTYMSNFNPVWKAFTRHPIWDLKTFTGKRVCFRNLIFPLLPRMIFGLYYNTPLIWGCERSGLFHAFSRHVLHRLQVPEHPRTSSAVKITLLSRESAYRNILNEQELLSALQANPDYQVQRVVYNRHMDFQQQLELTRNSDIFVGIHGAGLTHLLFLPDWAVVFELYNCEDESCYLDLARLRGVKYITWENKEKLWQEDEGHHPDGGAHAKFTNYKFDVDEFLRLVSLGAEHVRNHTSFPARISHDEL
ncbi:EGF domain-specific O-linked N-acetylglucosamine transferase [Macrosteles quadrilineatus]|uniref:EGF domain-specific O-linked N-acetylglucosamine transferase n=1 Tax=Macrosteles quadrilineatus TaxID=74068 RepID=UPI0023E0D9D1|nr:EGF domain-specific O-linked N-acetylglucosamine transferase [Macrosteles quadrilineatus]XP_054283092.1 EGF domain-specific O-linked N-acetylglucosamine transferase [Macrosteles quadrilineatus]